MIQWKRKASKFFKKGGYMYSNYPNFYQAQQQAAPKPFGLKGRPVSSLDEVRGTTIDFDGSVFYFPDLANKRIYTKQINMDGTATLNMYELKNIPIESNSSYITRDEFESTIEQIKSLFNQIITTPPAVQQNTSSVANQF